MGSLCVVLGAQLAAAAGADASDATPAAPEAHRLGVPGVLERSADPSYDSPDTGGDGTGDAGYEAAEAAGAVVNLDENRNDGTVLRFRDGHLFGKEGSLVEVDLSKKKVAVGQEYLVYRPAGELIADIPKRQDLGELDISVGVLRVTKVTADLVLAKVVDLYENVEEGDSLRLRSRLQKSYDALLDAPPPAKMGPLTGEVVGMVPPKLLGSSGDILYLSLGASKGLRPGMRLRIDDDVSDRVLPEDADDGEMPMGPIDALLPSTDNIKPALPSGAIAVVEVVNATQGACAARILRESSPVRTGSRVLYP
jgi:hypothetical protein